MVKRWQIVAGACLIGFSWWFIFQPVPKRVEQQVVLPKEFIGTWVHVRKFEHGHEEQMKQVSYSRYGFSLYGNEFAYFSPQWQEDSRIRSEFSVRQPAKFGDRISIFTQDEVAKVWYGCQVRWEDENRVYLNCEYSGTWGGWY
jgi:hypothetical protein